MCFRVIKIKTAKNISLDRGVINGKAGKAAVLSKISDTLTLSQPGRGADYARPLALLHLKFSMITPLLYLYSLKFTPL